MKKFCVIGFSLVMLLCAGCSDDNPSSPYTKSGREALVIVVEDNKFFATSQEEEEMFAPYRDQWVSILADVFEIDVHDMDGMTLVEVIDVYGEDWMITELEKTATPYYSKIVALTDDTATSRNILDTLQSLSNEGFVIDMIFGLHGHVNRVCFAGDCESIQGITTQIASNNIPIRALYQTCCYGSSTIDNWERIGIIAVSGAKGSNRFGAFSPIYFLQHWTRGMTFEAAVEAAFHDEHKKLKSYQAQSPLVEVFLTENDLDASTQRVGGQNTSLLWQDFSSFH
jgi:hypothetical protein